jgi:peptidoglycan L-alanyl-D-glutamate endopeptidase CwlK
MAGRYKYGRKSRKQLDTVTGNLQAVFERVLALGLIDITIVQGRRSKYLQTKYFNEGKSRVKWPNSKHNVKNPDDLARAIDAAPYVNGAASWDPRHCIFLAGLVLAVAALMDVKVRWGGNWDMDGEPITDQDFQDLVHFEELV